MILAIGIYYLVGMIIAIIGGICWGFNARKNNLSDEEMERLFIESIRKFGLKEMCSKFGPAWKIVLDIMSIIFIPVLALMMTCDLILRTDHYINEKQKAES